MVPALRIETRQILNKSQRTQRRVAVTRKKMARPCVLCLHGYAQSAAEMEAFMAPTVEALKGLFEFRFVDAPHRAQATELILTEGLANPRCWWLAQKNVREEWEYNGVSAALDCVAAAEHALVRETGKGFEGILGFSQGAAMASLVAALFARHSEAAPLQSLRFAVLVSGFPWRDVKTGHRQLFEAPTPISLPSLHVISDEDQVVKPRLSDALARFFAEPAWYRHDSGHRVPREPAWLAAFATFLASASSGASGRSKL